MPGTLKLAIRLPKIGLLTLFTLVAFHGLIFALVSQQQENRRDQVRTRRAELINRFEERNSFGKRVGRNRLSLVEEQVLQFVDGDEFRLLIFGDAGRDFGDPYRIVVTSLDYRVIDWLEELIGFYGYVKCSFAEEESCIVLTMWEERGDKFLWPKWYLIDPNGVRPVLDREWRREKYLRSLFEQDPSLFDE